MNRMCPHHSLIQKLKRIKLLFNRTVSVKNNRLYNTVINVQGALGKHKSTTPVVSFHAREKTKAINVKLLPHKEHGGEMKSLKSRKRKYIRAANSYIHHPHFMKMTYSLQTQNRQNSIGLQLKTSNISIVETSCIEFFRQNEHKKQQNEGTEHVRDVV